MRKCASEQAWVVQQPLPPSPFCADALPYPLPVPHPLCSAQVHAAIQCDLGGWPGRLHDSGALQRRHSGQGGLHFGRRWAQLTGVEHNAADSPDSPVFPPAPAMAAIPAVRRARLQVAHHADRQRAAALRPRHRPRTRLPGCICPGGRPRLRRAAQCANHRHRAPGGRRQPPRELLGYGACWLRTGGKPSATCFSVMLHTCLLVCARPSRPAGLLRSCATCTPLPPARPAGHHRRLLRVMCLLPRLQRLALLLPEGRLPPARGPGHQVSPGSPGRGVGAG